jgi:hypothetical protein
VTEFPSEYDLPEELVQRIHEWEDQNLGPDGMHACEYEAELSVACGTKVGGYLQWIQFPWQPACKCGRSMEHLLTIDSVEWNGVDDQRWTPEEGPARHNHTDDQWGDQRANWNPTGLMLGDAGHMHLFVCRHCGRWPIVPGIECS